MTRQDFIFLLFDSGDGLTLDQIELMDSKMIKAIPDGTIEDIIQTSGVGKLDAINRALDDERDVCIDNLSTAHDMFELRDMFARYWQVELSDMQVFRMWCVICR